MCDLTSAGDDLEPGLPRAGDKEPNADNQPPHRCHPLHVFQHRWQPLRLHLQGQEDPAHGRTLRKPAAGTAVCVCVWSFVFVWTTVLIFKRKTVKAG